MRVLDALIFKDEFGEGCPADWHKGDKGIDMSAKEKTGSLEIKKSWSEWARPKLNRAWSANSQRSVASFVSGIGNGHSRLRSDSNNHLVPMNGNGQGSAYHSALPSGQQSPVLSPMFSPTSGINVMSGRRMETQLDEALMQQRMDNLQATMQNQGIDAAEPGQQQSVDIAN